MKNFKLLLATAVVFAVGSAFTASPKDIGDEYVLQGGTYQLRSSVPGDCVGASGTCSYTKIANSGSQPDQNPANFQPRTAGTFIPN